MYSEFWTAAGDLYHLNYDNISGRRALHSALVLHRTLPTAMAVIMNHTMNHTTNG